MEWHIIPTGRVWVDPGGAFGLVPRVLWSRYQPPNEQGLTPMDLNSLLIFSEGKTILVDTGIGSKLSKKVGKNWGLEWPEGTMLENLAKHNLTRNDIDIVLLTHLHSDHCGGNTELVDEQVKPTFPNAEYWLQRLEFADALNANVRTRGTYLPENFKPIWESGQFRLLHGDTQVTKDVRTVVTRGHTRGHQSIILEGGSQPIFFISDLAAYSILFSRAAWVTAYDVEPLETIASKQAWQSWVLENDALIVFQHDSLTRTGKMVKTDAGKLVIETIEAGSTG